MSGICSKHRHHEPGCRLCGLEPRDVLPDYDRKCAEAKAAGEYQCANCEFVYYRTTDLCPLCGARREEPSNAD